MLATFREIVRIAADDGLTFDIDALRVDLIRDELEYGGLRLRTTAALAGARMSIVIDIGFGDAVEPGIEEIDLPVLLDLPAPHLRAYSRETVIAEKFQAMVTLGSADLFPARARAVIWDGLQGANRSPRLNTCRGRLRTAMARICNAADRPKLGCAYREGIDRRFLRYDASLG